MISGGGEHIFNYDTIIGTAWIARFRWEIRARCSADALAEE